MPSHLAYHTSRVILKSTRGETHGRVGTYLETLMTRPAYLPRPTPKDTHNMSEIKYDATEQFGDWDSVPDAYIMPAPGIYRGKIASAKSSPTKEGKPQINVDVQLQEHVASGEPVSGTSKFNRCLITQGAGGFRVKQLVQAAGVDFPASPSPHDVDAFCDSLVGQEVHFRIKHEAGQKDKSRTYMVVDRYFTAEQAAEAANASAAA